MKKNKNKKPKGNQFIKEPIAFNNNINLQEIEEFSKIDYPLFSFKYLQEISIKDCKDYKFYHDYIFRLQKLSILGWKEIQKSDRHSFGTEIIAHDMIKPDLPRHITPEVTLYAMRANGNNLPFIGYREGKVFHVIFIETNFGDIYDHR